MIFIITLILLFEFLLVNLVSSIFFVISNSTYYILKLHLVISLCLIPGLVLRSSSA